MNHQMLFILSLCLASLAMALWGGTLAWRAWRMRKVNVHLEQTVKERDESITALVRAPDVSMLAEHVQEQDNIQASLPGQNDWIKTSWGQVLFAQEDKELMDQAGIDLKHGAPVFVVSRLILAALLPMLAILISNAQGKMIFVYIFFGLGLGLMLPKWIVRSMASKRRQRAQEELPLFVDLLRLLQGVGLSIDQSLHILAHEFSSVLRVLGAELALANNLYATGRTREQSLQRLNRLSGDDDMTAIVNLLVQVDRHGGAVQEPLKQFAQRLREKRQASFKEKIGTITVKMTGVMVLTLLPALIVITAGPGFMAVIRSLSSMNGG